MSRLFTSLGFLLLFSVQILAQPENKLVKDVTLPAPNAASLGKYGDIPVSYFTGVPDISIPIYTVQDGPLALPISISYHASGHKVGEMSSWVGMGWSLSAGGMISRTVMGIPDDVPEGYMDKGRYLLNPATSAATQQRDSVALGTRDAEPDLFNISLPGYSGKVVFDKDNIPHFLPKSDLKISYVRKTSGSAKSIVRFVVLTTDGTRY